MSAGTPRAERDVTVTVDRRAGTLAVVGILLLPAALAADAAASVPEHRLLPMPAQVDWLSGTLALEGGASFATHGACDDRVTRAIARTAKALGLPPQTGSRRPAKVTVECTSAGDAVPSLGEDESYRLEVGAAGARLAAATSVGALRGLETLEQLAHRDGAKVSLPAVRIEDRPRFPWRGLLIDPARRFLPVPVVKRILDGMAAVKLNVLHWHLTEDQGFRLESRTFPRLAEQGSDGRFYSQAEVRDVVAYAGERGIRVVPEFDMPGHVTAWLVGHPELASRPGPYAIERRFGIKDPTLDPTREEVYRFVEAFLKEVAGLFPDAYLHTGGDEVTGRQWNESPAIRDFMYDHGLRDAEALQAFFSRRLSGVVEAAGKRMVVWDEVLHKDDPGGPMVQVWRSAEPLARAVRQGSDALVSFGYYLDHLRPAAFHYAIDPAPSDLALSPAEVARIRGGEACMWGELVDGDNVESRIWPRAGAVAERLWSPASVRDPDDMYRRLWATSRSLEAKGLRHRASSREMLARLVSEQAQPALGVLADVCEPAGLGPRARSRIYATDTPLDRLVDALPAESEVAWSFAREVDRVLASPAAARPFENLRTRLAAWAGNHALLDPALAASARGREARSLSRDLSALGVLGQQALEALATGQAPPGAWKADALRLLDATESPQAEVRLAVTPAIRKLVLAAAP